MHELSIAKSIVESVTEICRKDQVEKVKEVTLDIGALSGVVKYSMEFCWPSATKKTILENSNLIVNEIPLTVHCNDCQKISSPEIFIVACALCSSNNVEIKSGQELNIKSMEVL